MGTLVPVGVYYTVLLDLFGWWCCTMLQHTSQKIVGYILVFSTGSKGYGLLLMKLVCKMALFHFVLSRETVACRFLGNLKTCS